ncbi:MOSC domain-containing protein [Neptunicoccus cionae]|uniref:MOSC domain-containing protein n=1 Tax=Neptunicoccus cionae TaxID=2035344 RepID=UPI000C75BB8C|nr:MOSC domain-containing protein [Amylibacter cionae]PLS23352.1 sulfurase [Amylibacter cionae]
MPALKPTTYSCEIVYLGVVPDREAALASDSHSEVFASFAGVEGECHAGLTRPSCSRVLSQHPRGTEIRNARQFSIVSAEELDLIAAEIGLDSIDPAWLGASIMVRGLPDFTFIPPSSRLQTEEGTTLVVDMENRPCIFPGKEELEPRHPGKGKLFKTAATNRRGVTAWVEREGVLRVGDRFTLHIPDQRQWAPEA